MNKSIMIVLVICIAAGVVILPMTCINQSMYHRKAEQATSQGNHSSALKYYILALIREYPPTIAIPDFTKTPGISSKKQKKLTEVYVKKNSNLKKRTDSRFTALVTSITASAKKSPQTLQLTQINKVQAALDAYSKKWQAAFYTPTNSSHTENPIMIKARSKNLSIVEFISHSGQEYELYLFNVSTSKCTQQFIQPGSSATFLAAPDNHLLVCRGIVKSSGAQIIRSSASAHLINFPGNSSVIKYQIH